MAVAYHVRRALQAGQLAGSFIRGRDWRQGGIEQERTEATVKYPQGLWDRPQRHSAVYPGQIGYQMDENIECISLADLSQARETMT